MRNVRINSYKANYLRLYGFMLFSGSIESDNHNGAIEIFEGIFLHLYGFMLLSGSIESDNHNVAIEIFDKRSDK